MKKNKNNLSPGFSRRKHPRVQVKKIHPVGGWRRGKKSDYWLNWVLFSLFWGFGLTWFLMISCSIRIGELKNAIKIQILPLFRGLEAFFCFKILAKIRGPANFITPVSLRPPPCVNTLSLCYILLNLSLFFCVHHILLSLGCIAFGIFFSFPFFHFFTFLFLFFSVDSLHSSWRFLWAY